MYSRQVRVLLGKLEVEPDVSGLAVAGAPLGLHAPDAPALHRPSDLGSHFAMSAGIAVAQLRRGASPEAASAALSVSVPCRHVEQQPLAVDLDVRRDPAARRLCRRWRTPQT